MGLFTRVDAVFISVQDLERSKAWYMEAFGFEQVQGAAEAGAKTVDIQVGKGQTRLTLLKESPPRPNIHLHEAGHVPCFNFYTHAEDLHEAELANYGVTMTEPMDVPWMKVSEFSDLDGNVTGICHERETSLFFTPSVEMMEPMFHRVLAVFLPVADVAASISWYVEVLGWTLVNNWVEGADFRVGEGETIVTMIRMEPVIFQQAVKAGEHRSYFSLAVEDIHATQKALQSNGVETTPLVHKSGTDSVMFNLRSPEGLLIAVSGERVKVYA